MYWAIFIVDFRLYIDILTICLADSFFEPMAGHEYCGSVGLKTSVLIRSIDVVKITCIFVG